MSSRVADVVEREIAAGGYAGAAVGAVVRGAPVLEHYAGEAAPGLPSSPSVAWPLASISKLFTAAMVMRLVDQGELGLDMAPATFLPQFRGDGREDVRLRQLLCHTAGLRYESPELERLLVDRVPLRAIVDDAMAAPLLYPPGSRFSYSDDGYLLAGHLAQVVTGNPYAELVQSLIVDDMGLRDTWVVAPLAVRDRVARVRGVLGEGTDGAMYNSDYGLSLGHPAFGVVSSLPGLLRFAAHFAPGGPRILHDRSVQLMTTPQAGAVPGRHILHPELGDGIAVGWGLGFEVQTGAIPNTLCSRVAPGSFGHPGATGCRLVVDPATATTVAVLTNTHMRTGIAAWKARIDELVDAAFDAAAAAAG